MIDRESLLAWLESAADTHRLPLVQAIYDGLAQRVRAGQFDKENE